MREGGFRQGKAKVSNIREVGKVGKVGNAALRNVGDAKVRGGALPEGNLDPSARCVKFGRVP